MIFDSVYFPYAVTLLVVCGSIFILIIAATIIFKFSTIEEMNVTNDNTSDIELEKIKYGEWLPIETAPRDSLKWILLGYFPDYLDGNCLGDKPRIGYWNNVKKIWTDDCGRNLRAEGVFSPTHWMPLPKPFSSTILVENNCVLIKQNTKR